MNDFSILNSSEDLHELDKQFSLDELDNWQTMAGLTESAITMISDRIPGSSSQIFVHVSESREYREIDREGLATIPEDSLFIACLAMQNGKISVDELFQEYELNDPFLHELIRSTYCGEFIYDTQQLLAHNISNIYFGVFIPKVFLGRSFNKRAILLTCA